MKRIIVSIFLAGACLSLCGCSSAPFVTDETLALRLSEVRKETVVDSRTTLFDISAVRTDNRIILSGKTTSPSVIEALERHFAPSELTLENRVLLVPALSEDSHCLGIVSVPATTLYSRPEYTAHVLTQAPMGTRIGLLNQSGTWFQIQLPDGYIGWVPGAQILRLNTGELRHMNQTENRIITATHATLYGDSQLKTPLAPLTSGSLLSVVAAGSPLKVRAGSKTGFIPESQTQPIKDLVSHWKTLRSNSGRYRQALSELARRYLGTSYLWAGTTASGFDCSGLTSHLYLMTGLILPRDSDQQAQTGPRVSDHTQAGDLLFFGKASTDGKPVISHVGLALDENTFIHSQGEVQLASLNVDSPYYDAYNRNRFLFAVRPQTEKLPTISANLIDRISR